MVDDDEARKREAAARRRQADADSLAIFRAHMDPQHTAELKRRAEMQVQAQYLYRQGDTKGADRLVKALAPPKV